MDFATSLGQFVGIVLAYLPAVLLLRFAIVRARQNPAAD